MEVNIKKQAKSDIHTALDKVITFDLSRGIKPESLKRYYKKDSHFKDILKRIRNKCINLFEDENEYKETVREILDDMLQDRIYADKDKKASMKHIKNIKDFKKEE